MSVIFIHNSCRVPPLKKPKIFPCYVCSNTFTQMSNLRKHLRNIHRIQMNLRRKGTDYTCSVCSLTFSRKTNLKRHQVSIHKIDEDKLEYSVRFLCNTCTAAFDNQAALRVHRKNRHGEDDVKIDNPYECGECGELFQKKGLLKNHMRCRHLSETDNYQFLKNILPSMTNSLNVIWYSVLNEVEEHFKAKFTMSIKNRAEIDKWINEFQYKNKITLRKRSVHRTIKSNVIYQVKYGCHHNTKPKANSTHVSAKHTKCEASIALKLFALSNDTRNYAEVRLIHTHNHVLNSLEVLKFREPIEEVKTKFKNMFMSGMTPSQALLQHKKDLEQQYGDEFSTVVGDRGICPNKSWVYNYRGICFKKKDEELIGVRNSSKDEGNRVDQSVDVSQAIARNDNLNISNNCSPLPDVDAYHSDDATDYSNEIANHSPSNFGYSAMSRNDHCTQSRNIIHVPYTTDSSDVKMRNSKIVFTTVPKLKKVHDFPEFAQKFDQSYSNFSSNSDQSEKNISNDIICDPVPISSDSNEDIIVLNEYSDKSDSVVVSIQDKSAIELLDAKNMSCSDNEIFDCSAKRQTDSVIVNALFSHSDFYPVIDEPDLENVFLEFDQMNEIIKEKVKKNKFLAKSMRLMVQNFYKNLQDVEALNDAFHSFGN